MSAPNLSYTTANIDVVLEAAKRIKAAKGRYGNKGAKEQEARDALRALQVEAHAITTAMIEGKPTDGMRDLADVQKDLQKAHNTLDKAIERGHDDADAMAEAFGELVRALSEPLVPVASTEQKEAA